MVKENLTKMSSVEMESKNVDVYVWLVKYLREVCWVFVHQPVNQKHLAVVCPMRNVCFSSKASYKWSLQQGELPLEKTLLLMNSNSVSSMVASLNLFV